jgi:hypothetical protein
MPHEQRDYFLLIGTSEEGPFSVAELQAMLAAGEVESEILCARPGMREWKPLSAMLPVAQSRGAAKESVGIPKHDDVALASHPEGERLSPEESIIETFVSGMFPLGNKSAARQAVQSIRLIVEGRAKETDARQDLKAILRSLDYQPAKGKEGTLEDLSSDARLNLTVQTSADLARSYGQREGGMTEATLDEWPCMELKRAETREVPRGTKEGYPDQYWQRKWKKLGGTLYDGRMICSKDDPIAQEVSDFGLPYGPPGLDSGYVWFDVDREEAVALGVLDRNGEPIDDDTVVTPESRALDEHFKERLEHALNDLVSYDPLGESMG